MRPFIKWSAVACNLLFLVIGFIFLLHEGVPRKTEDFLLAIALGLFPAINVWAILDDGTPIWIALYFKRKALEEQKKIDTLT